MGSSALSLRLSILLLAEKKGNGKDRHENTYEYSYI